MFTFLRTLPFVALLTPTVFAAIPIPQVGGETSIHHQLDGSFATDYHGASVAGVADVNGDGHDDILVGAPFASPGGRAFAGSAFLYSGADGSLLYQYHGVDPSDHLGDAVSGAGDANNDGFGDFLIGAPDTNTPVLNGTGTVYLYSGATGTLLYAFIGTDAFDHIGISVGAAGDVDGDGFDDIIFGSSVDPPGLSGAGTAFVYSGNTGAQLHEFPGATSFMSFARSVNGAGDGSADVIVGAPEANAPLRNNAGTATLFSGASGAVLWTFEGEDSRIELGTSVSGGHDLDGDGVPDLVAGAPFADQNGLLNNGSVYAYSGRVGDILLRYDGVTQGSELGTSVDLAEDVDGDLRADVVAGAPEASPGGIADAGTTWVLGVHPFLFLNFHEVSAAGGGTLNLDIDFPTAAASEEYRTIISGTGTGPTPFGVDIPISVDAYVLQTYAGSYPFPASSNLQGILDASGDAVGSATIPAGLPAGLVGNHFWFVVIANLPGLPPDYSSKARRLTILP